MQKSWGLILEKSAKGFSLIEVLIAVSILSIGILSVSAMITAAGKTGRISLIADKALLSVQEEIIKIVSTERINTNFTGEKIKGIFKISYRVEVKNQVEGKSLRLLKIIVKEAATDKERARSFYIMN